MRLEVARLLRFKDSSQPRLGCGCWQRRCDRSSGTAATPRRSQRRSNYMSRPRSSGWSGLAMSLSHYTPASDDSAFETDANSRHHDPTAPEKSRFNFVISGNGLRVAAPPRYRRTHARMVDCAETNTLDDTGELRVELSALDKHFCPTVGRSPLSSDRG